MKIVFMGTPDFAVDSLKALIDSEFEIVSVVTAPDKPVGRGLQIQSSPVKNFSISNNLPVLEPINLKDPNFAKQLQEINADLFVVVAFRMLPEIVWSMPRLGTINLHASLLPDYRGAAPINWAIIRGETITGVTTFFIEKQIDTGNILMQEKVTIDPFDTAGILHDKLSKTGASLLVKTVQAIEKGEFVSIPQEKEINNNRILKNAPKIFKKNCQINWISEAKSVFDLIRGLSPYPGAWTNLQINENTTLVAKIFESNYEICSTQNYTPGEIVTDQKNILKVATINGFIHIRQIQLEGKRRLDASDFLRGFHFKGNEKFITI